VSRNADNSGSVGGCFKPTGGQPKIAPINPQAFPPPAPDELEELDDPVGGVAPDELELLLEELDEPVGGVAPDELELLLEELDEPVGGVAPDELELLLEELEEPVGGVAPDELELLLEDELSSSSPPCPP
jgi:hypothetical protein